MKEKTKNILELLAIIIIMIIMLIVKVIPEYKASIGSSDKYIDTDNFVDLIEFTINNKTNFALVTDTKNVTNILFFEETSLCLYNQQLEGKPIEEAVSLLTKTLIDNDFLKESSYLVLTNYKDKTYLPVKQALTAELLSLNLTIQLEEKASTLEAKAASLNVSSDEEITLLKNLELYSKDLIRHVKNDVTASTETKEKEEVLTEELAKTYCDNVYKKIDDYAKKNNITMQEAADSNLPITLIPANKTGTIFPDNSSSYYIADSKVYAYISITANLKTYSYCYNGSLLEARKGEC